MRARIDLGSGKGLSTPWGVYRYVVGEYNPATGVVLMDTAQESGRTVPAGTMLDTRARVLIQALPNAKGEKAA